MTPVNLINRLSEIVGRSAAETYARIIMRHLKGWTAVDLAVHLSDDFSPFIVSEITKIISRMEVHEPIQYIVGEEYFCGYYFKTEPGVLIPRPETQELVDRVIDSYKNRCDLRVLDLCCGSGCIAVTLALALPFSDVTAIDISQKATLLTAENAKRLNAKVRVAEDDIFSYSAPDNPLDIIISNPPYIALSERKDMDPEVLNYEPAEALFVDDEDPLIFYRRISVIAMQALKDGGTLWLEINPLFADELKNMLEASGLHDVEIMLDSYGRKRFAYARKSSADDF